MKALFIFLFFLSIFSCKTTTKTTSKPAIDKIAKPSMPAVSGNKLPGSESQIVRIKKEVQGAKVEIMGEGVSVTFDESLSGNNILLFPAGSSALTFKGKESLNSLVKICLDFPDSNIKIESHTDDVGPAADNMVLTQRRAFAVENYLKFKKIHPHRLMVRWYGETWPKVKNINPLKRAENRRIEIMITPYAK